MKIEFILKANDVQSFKNMASNFGLKIISNDGDIFTVQGTFNSIKLFIGSYYSRNTYNCLINSLKKKVNIMEMQSVQYAIYNPLTKQLASFDYEEGVWSFTSHIVNAYCTETKSTAEFWLEMPKYAEVLKNCVVVKIVSTIDLEY